MDIVVKRGCFRLDLATPNVPHKTKKRVLVKEGSGFVEDLLAPVVSSLGFLML